MRGAKSRHTHIQAYTLTTTRICTALGTNTALRLQIFDPELRHKHVSAPPGWAGWGIEIWGHSDIGVLVYRGLEHQTRDYGVVVGICTQSRRIYSGAFYHTHMQSRAALLLVTHACICMHTPRPPSTHGHNPADHTPHTCPPRHLLPYPPTHTNTQTYIHTYNTHTRTNPSTNSAYRPLCMRCTITLCFSIRQIFSSAVRTW